MLGAKKRARQSEYARRQSVAVSECEEDMDVHLGSSRRQDKKKHNTP